MTSVVFDLAASDERQKLKRDEIMNRPLFSTMTKFLPNVSRTPSEVKKSPSAAISPSLVRRKPPRSDRNDSVGLPTDSTTLHTETDSASDLSAVHIETVTATLSSPSETLDSRRLNDSAGTSHGRKHHQSSDCNNEPPEMSEDVDHGSSAPPSPVQPVGGLGAIGSYYGCDDSDSNSGSDES